MNTDEKSLDSGNRFLERLLGVAGGAILAGSIGMLIFNSMDRDIANHLLGIIVGLAAGVVRFLQEVSLKAIKKKIQGEKD